jgi:pimeloyl-ACP methyl ester carboxylesterase
MSAISITGRRMIAVVVALAVTLAVAMLSPAGGPVQRAEAQGVETRRPVIFIPGLMGSRLCRSNPDNPAEPTLVWGDVGALQHFPPLQLKAGSADIKPCGVIREIVFLGLFTQEIYGPALQHLHSLGYSEGADLFVFDYDWRKSVFDNAKRLAKFVDEKIPQGQRADIVAHSMGGLIARVYAIKHDGAARIARLFSAGSPFLGSAKVYETAEQGWGVLNPVMGGLATFRRTMLSFPSIFELAPRYEDCCRSEGKAFAMTNAKTWHALKWEGADPAAMPDLAAGAARAQELQRIVETPLPAGTEDVLLIGVDQRTPMQVAFQLNDEGAAIRVRTSWDGDATVLRDSAVIKGATVYRTSFATHEQILHDPDVLRFLTAALTGSVAQAKQSVPVRPRARVRGVDGSVTQLVGIVVTPREPLCRAGGRCGVHVHVRLGAARTLPLAALNLAYRAPDGRQASVTLQPDPSASDPSVPLEQSFTGTFEAGSQQGVGTLTATVALAGGASRMVERPVAVVAR